MGLEERNEEITRRAEVEFRRQRVREGLSTLFLPFYDWLLVELDKDPRGRFFMPTVGLRSISEQDALYAQGRTTRGAIVTNARGGSSAHNWGCAVDFIENRPGFRSQDVFTKADWAYFGACVGRSGLRWGGDWDMDGKAGEPGENDRPHAELWLFVTWAQVKTHFDVHGRDAALDFIKRQQRVEGPGQKQKGGTTT